MTAKQQTNGEAKPARKRPGPPKGSRKVPGSGRKANVTNWTALEVRQKLLPDAVEKMIAILKGEAVLCGGPTGKAVKRRPTLDQQIRVLDVALRKCVPDLSAVALSGDADNPVAVEHSSPRDLARSVLTILETARLEAEEPAPEPPPHHALLMIERQKIIGLNAVSDAATNGSPSQGEASGISGSLGVSPVGSPAARPGGGVGEPDAAGDDAVAPAPSEPQHGERVLLNENGAEVVYAVQRSKWAVHDHLGKLHAWRRGKQEALEFAEQLLAPSLKSNAGPDQPSPREDVWELNSRRDARPFSTHRPPKVLRRAPR